MWLATEEREGGRHDSSRAIFLPPSGYSISLSPWYLLLHGLLLREIADAAPDSEVAGERSGVDGSAKQRSAYCADFTSRNSILTDLLPALANIASVMSRWTFRRKSLAIPSIRHSLILSSISVEFICTSPSFLARYI